MPTYFKWSLSFRLSKHDFVHTSFMRGTCTYTDKTKIKISRQFFGADFVLQNKRKLPTVLCTTFTPDLVTSDGGHLHQTTTSCFVVMFLTGANLMNPPQISASWYVRYLLPN